LSKLRLLSTYSTMAVLLAISGWFAFATFPLVGNAQAQPGRLAAAALTAEPAGSLPQLRQKPAAGRSEMSMVASVPVPPDPNELAAARVQVASSPADRAAALGLFERAMQNTKLHMPGTPPYQIHVSFTAAGDTAYVGSGELTETWLSGQVWRWTASLGNFSIVRIGSQGITVEDRHVTQIPSRIQMLRNSIFWAAETAPSDAQIRTAAVQWNGRPATCVLTSRVAGPAAQTQGRLWEEEEYCIDNATGAIQILSIAPGTYTVYGYSRNQQFHGRLIPDRITISVAGATILDAQMDMTDSTVVNAGQLAPKPEMLANGPVITLMLPTRFALDSPVASPTGMVQPVIVHAQISADGSVVEAELCAASNSSLAQSALDLVRQTTFPPTGLTQRQAYINVRFVPPSQ